MKNQSESFFFYDYETFGIHPAKDRISQFGGIRTDMELNIIDTPIMLYCKPSDDYLPHPEAVLITGITPQMCQQQGLPEPEFCALIHEQMSTPNTCTLGYNSLRFDDEMTRYLFFRNFFDPYAHTWQNNNSRWDLIDLIRTCYALRPEGIVWPKDEQQHPIFKLSLLTQANGIDHDHAHDALSDVYATIELAKLIKRTQPKLFEHFFKLRRAKSLTHLIDLESLTPLVHVSGMFGAARSNCSIIAPVVYHPINKNMLICVDLMGDVSKLVTLSSDVIREKMYTASTNLEENETRIPIKSVHLNKAPILAELKTLPKTNHLPIDINLCQKNHDYLLQHRDLISLSMLHVFKHTEHYPPQLAEGRLYEGFLNAEDSVNLTTLRSLNGDALAQHTIVFKDDRLNDLVFLYRAKHFPESLTEIEVAEWQHIKKSRLLQQQSAFESALLHAKQTRLQDPTTEYLQQLELLAQLESYANQLLQSIN